MTEFLNVLLPVYNEHNRLEAGVRKADEYLSGLIPGDYLLTIVDNASSDDTPEIAARLCEELPQVRYIGLEDKGVGLAFRAGVAENESLLIGYMDVDLSTDVSHLAEVLFAFCDDPTLGMVNGSRWSKASDTQGRKWHRNIASHGLTLVLKAMLGMRASDSICGFKFFRKDVAESLIREAGQESDGWFYIIELLLRAERGGVKVLELPVRWTDDYDSTVRVVAQTKEYLVEIADLRKRFRREASLR